MRDPREAAAPNHPDVSIPSLRTLKSLLVLGAAALLASCTQSSATSRIPASEIPQPTPPLVLPPFQMDTGATSDLVPPFQPTPLIVWGPAPPGVSHPERTSTYDLQHQATTVRFDWPRQGVNGT